MINIEKLSIILSSFALIFSIAAFIITIIFNWRLHKRNKQFQRANFNFEVKNAYEPKLADWPEAYALHGIDLIMAKKEGVSKEQLTYLILCINSLTSYAQFNDKCVQEILEDFTNDGNYYYKTLFESEKTRKAWKYARKFFSKKTVYQIDSFIVNDLKKTLYK